MRNSISTFAEDGHQDDGLESSTHIITRLRNFRFFLDLCRYRAFTAALLLFERSEFLIHTIQKKGVCVYPFNLILDCCRGYADRQGHETRGMKP